jgi:hypothetical protein
VTPEPDDVTVTATGEGCGAFRMALTTLDFIDSKLTWRRCD